MYKLLFLALSLCALAPAAFAQQAAAPQPAPAASASPEKPKRAPSFRANKDQIREAQTKFKAAGGPGVEPTGRYDEATRAAIKKYQKDNGLRSSGSLNRATLEKMGIALTDAQKAIPVSPNSFAAAKEAPGSADAKPKRVIFRATKDQIKEAQAKMKTGGMYAGEQTGTLDDATRDGIRKFQEANGIKVTGTLNRVTLEKMGVTLTEKQKADAAAEAK